MQPEKQIQAKGDEDDAFGVTVSRSVCPYQDVLVTGCAKCGYQVVVGDYCGRCHHKN